MTRWINAVLFEEAGDGGQGGGGGDGGGGTATDTPATQLTTPTQGAPDKGSFKDSLPEDLRNDASLKDIKDVASLAKSFVHAQSMVGKDRMPVPDENWSEGQWNDFYDKLGRPKSPDEYPEPSVQIEEDDKANLEPVEKRIKQVAHKNGLTPKQAKTLLDEVRAIYKEDKTNAKTNWEKAEQDREAKLKSEFGQDLSIVLDTGRQVLDKLGDEEFVEYLNETRLGSDHRMVRFLNKVGSLIKEDKGASGGPGIGGFSAGSPAQARAELDMLMNDKSFVEALHNEHHANHKWAVEKRMSLYNQMS